MIKPSVIASVSGGTVAFSATWVSSVALAGGHGMLLALGFAPVPIGLCLLAVIGAAGDRRNEAVESALAEQAGVQRHTVAVPAQAAPRELTAR